jgi:diacylglycerol kinase family enzyme
VRKGAILKPFNVVVLINASSGSVAGKDESIRNEMSAGFALHGIMAEFQFLHAGQLKVAAEMARGKVAAGELNAIIVSGGDGTIGTVAGVLADSGVPLGVIPGGTFNHFAKDLKIPLKADEAIAVISAGQLRSVDAGEVNEKLFINNSSIGIYPYLVVERERSRTHGLPKLVAMSWAILRAIQNLPIRRLSVTAEGWTERLRSPCAFVGNNEYIISGPRAGTRDRMNAGKLSLLMARDQSLFKLILLALRAVLGLLSQSRDLRMTLLSSVTVNSRRPQLLVALDGEVEPMSTPLHYKIRPHALLVFAPSNPR